MKLEENPIRRSELAHEELFETGYHEKEEVFIITQPNEVIVLDRVEALKALRKLQDFLA